ncbi:MAG: carboxylesterase family protein, partial [Pseudomonadota bacterium]
ATIVCAQIPEPVAVDGGRITGASSRDPAIRAFKGIPFAAPPTGELRWKAPQPVRSWEAVRAASEFAADCPQLRDSVKTARQMPQQSEDCLYLNIWTGAKSPGERRPVMVWIYGGGFRGGSTALAAYDGTALAGRDVVFVSIAYRVGALGFLAHPELSHESSRRVSGNYGLLDQIAALGWVRRNIAAFGGDPDRITVFGQSAGSMSASYLATSPLATGLFHRLIGQTGAGFGVLAPRPLAVAERKGAEFAAGLGAASLSALRRIDAARIVEAAGTVSGVFQPNDDGWVVPGNLALTYRERRQNDVAMLIGSNADESGTDTTQNLERFRSELRSQFAADAAAIEKLHPASSDVEARAAARRVSTITLGDYTMQRWARAQAETGTAPVYLYRFTQSPPIPREQFPGGPEAPPPGAWHGAEIPYALGNLASQDWPWTDKDKQLSQVMISYWINFARSGDPNGSGLPRWPAWKETSQELMELASNPRLIPQPDRATIEILRNHID